MRLLLDYTSALNQRGGVGRYTRSLVEALTRLHANDLELALWSARRSRRGSSSVNGGGLRPDVRELMIPERWLTFAWQRLRVPIAVEALAGSADVIHAPDFVAPPHRAPAIVTVHDLSYLVTPEYAHPNLRRYLSAAVPRSLRSAAGIVAVSQATADDIATRYRVDPSRITVIAHGVDPLFRPPSPPAVEDTLRRHGLRPPYFVMVGTIEPRKNHLGVLRAFEELAVAHPEASLVMVGRPGWLADNILAAIAAASRRLPVRLLPGVEDVSLPALYAGSVALVYPSWYEGFGLPVVEAMACGTAVITSDRGALAEVGGDAALTVSPDTPKAIAAAMTQLLDDPMRRCELVAAGMQRAAAFGWDTAAAAHLVLYRTVAEAGGAR